MARLLEIRRENLVMIITTFGGGERVHRVSGCDLQFFSLFLREDHVVKTNVDG